MNDTIADMLTRIRNASMVRKPRVAVLWSRINEAIARILVEEGYAESYEVEPEKPHGKIQITLKYVEQLPVITRIERVSKSGRRVYVGADEIAPVLAHNGISIVTTSKGVMTGASARKQGVGGEMLCTIW